MSRPVVGYTTGTFDMVHEDHFRLLRLMRARCTYLIVGITSDRLCRLQKRIPIMSQAQRMAILDNCRWVDATVLHDGQSKQTAHDMLRFDVLFIGDDYYGASEYKDFHATPVIYFPRGQSSSTSEIVRRMEQQFLDNLKPLAMGVTAPLLAYKSPDNHIVMKPIHVGFTESKSTSANAYGFPMPPPRNWKVKGAPEHKHINICGVHSRREVLIHQYIKHFDWNPVFKVRKRLTDARSQPVAPNNGNWTHVNLERQRPVEVWWLYQRFAGRPLLDWLQENKGSPELLLQKVTEVKALASFLRGQGIVHGDLHGRNVLIDRSGKLSIVDFGWCMHSSFEMDAAEQRYYLDCLDNFFDWTHFEDSLRFDLDWWPPPTPVSQA